MTYKKIFNWFMILMYIIVLLYVPFWWVTRQGKWKTQSEIEGRNLALFPTMGWEGLQTSIENLFLGNFIEAEPQFFQQFLDQSFQKAVNDAAMDQFPYRIKLISTAGALQRAQIHTAYMIFKDPAIPASLDTDYLIMRDEPVFIQYPVPFSYVSRSTIDKRVQNYRELIKSYPDKNFFIFYLERMAFAPYNPAVDFFPEADSGASFNYFIDSKPENLIVSSLRLESYPDHKENYFRTDHHWNIRGAWQGYSIIYDMLAEHFPDISPKLELQEFQVIEGAAFCGSYTRRTRVPCTPEPFEVALVNLPQYTTFIDGKEQLYGHRDQYLEGEYEQREFTYHYAEFYGHVIDRVDYHFINDSQRNLLILGNSYSQAVQAFIASHYRNTYVIDFRENTNFSIGEFLAGQKVDDILIVGDVITYGRENWFINP